MEACRTKDVDVVLMDIRMPQLDGLAATERIMAIDDPLRLAYVLATLIDMKPTDKEKAEIEWVIAELPSPTGMSMRPSSMAEYRLSSTVGDSR